MSIYLILFAVFLLLPGWMLLRLLAPRHSNLLASFAVSLAVLMANFVLFVHFRIPPAFLTAALIGEILLLTTCFVIAVDVPALLRNMSALVKENAPFFSGGLLALLVVGLYNEYAGLYTEVPADVWRHFGYTQWAYQSLESTRMPLPVHPWYYIPAWFRQLAGDDVFAFIHGFGNANTLLQGLGIYVFTHAIVRRMGLGASRAAATAWLAVPIAGFSIGVNVFSYLRYYAFGPMFHGMLVYFCCVLLLLELFERRRIDLVGAALLAVLAGTLYVVHNQEIAFLYAFLVTLSLVTVVRFSADARDASLYIAIGVIAASVLFFLYTHYTFPIRGNVRPWIIPIPGTAWTGIHLYIANPGYQVFESVTVWGLFVYLLFMLHWRTFRHSLFLVSGMLIPFVTVFNPLFVDMFLRYSEAAPIYRFIYAVPLYVVAACCLTGYAVDIARTKPSRKLAAAAGILMLVVLSLPSGLPALHNPNSRVHTLAPVPPGNDYHQWKDMIVFLGTLEPSEVITDPVTAYMIRGLTSHRARGYKFHQSRVPLDRDADFYAGFQGHLLVYNQRDGAMSANGKRAGHWPADVLRVSRYYPDSLEEIVDARPDWLKLIWQHDHIRVFRIQGKR